MWGEGVYGWGGGASLHPNPHLAMTRKRCRSKADPKTLHVLARAPSAFAEIQNGRLEAYSNSMYVA